MIVVFKRLYINNNKNIWNRFQKGTLDFNIVVDYT